jgi:VWFA-related protein
MPAPALAQTNSASETVAPSTAALRSTTRLVQLNVVVQNKSGQPVQDLTKDHFTLLDEGVPQQIAVFSIQSGSARSASTTPPLAPHIFTNRFDQSGQNPGSVTVILFDALNTSVMDQASARGRVVKFLRQLRPQDHVALYILTTKIITVNEFTQDASSLLAAINKFGGYLSAPLEASDPKNSEVLAAQTTTQQIEHISSQLRQFIEPTDDQLSDFANVDRALTTINAMEAIANHVARIPGRKNLIWVSGSFPISVGLDAESVMKVNREHRSFESELEHAARALDQANMAVYPVDARGLMTAPMYNASNSQAFSGRFPPKAADLGPVPETFDTMIKIADRTGGRAAYNTNDVEGAIRRAITDSEYTYTIGFYPSHTKWDGKFHELKLRVEDKGLTLRYRKGYFATPEPKDPAADNKQNLEAAIRSPVEWTNLDVVTALKAFVPLSRALTLQVAFDTHELQFTPKDGRQVGKIYVYFGQLGEGNKPLSSEQQSFDLNFKPDTYEKLQQIGTKFTGQIVLAPDIVNLRVVGQDATSGAIGTVTIPIRDFLATKITAASSQNAGQNSTKPN